MAILQKDWAYSIWVSGSVAKFLKVVFNFYCIYVKGARHFLMTFHPIAAVKMNVYVW